MTVRNMVPVGVLFRCPSGPGVLFHKKVLFVAITPQGHGFGTLFSECVLGCKVLPKRLNTLNMKSHYFLFGGGSFFPLRVAPDVKTFFDRLRPPRCGEPRELDPLDFPLIINSQKHFELYRAP